MTAALARDQTLLIIKLAWSESAGYVDCSDMGVFSSSTEPLRNGALRVAPSLLLGLALLGTGCVHRGRDSVVHFWGDYNTLNQPAFFIDKIHHQPPKSFTVDRYRWAYNRPPGGPLPGEAPYMGADPTTADIRPMPGTMAPDSWRFEAGGADSSHEMHDSLPLPPLPDEEFPEDSPVDSLDENDGPTVRSNPSAEFASLRRPRPSSANAATSLQTDASTQPAVASRPKGSWLFGGSGSVNR